MNTDLILAVILLLIFFLGLSVLIVTLSYRDRTHETEG